MEATSWLRKQGCTVLIIGVTGNVLEVLLHPNWVGIVIFTKQHIYHCCYYYYYYYYYPYYYYSYYK